MALNHGCSGLVETEVGVWASEVSELHFREVDLTKKKLKVDLWNYSDLQAHKCLFVACLLEYSVIPGVLLTTRVSQDLTSQTFV